MTVGNCRQCRGKWYNKKNTQQRSSSSLSSSLSLLYLTQVFFTRTLSRACCQHVNNNYNNNYNCNNNKFKTSLCVFCLCLLCIVYLLCICFVFSTAFFNCLMHFVIVLYLLFLCHCLCFRKFCHSLIRT